MNRETIAVWDLPTRLFHWSLVLLLGGLWISAEIGNEAMRYHEILGFLVLALVVTRGLWGVVGSSTARFSHFVRGPGGARAYLRRLRRGEAGHTVGHNPLGGWMVLLLLVLLLAQAVSGMFATDDLAFDGPLNYLVREHTAHQLTHLHHLGFDLLLGLVGLHVVAVVFYLVRFGVNLVRPMITGRKAVPEGWQGEAPTLRRGWLALMLFAAVAGGLYATIFR